MSNRDPRDKAWPFQQNHTTEPQATGNDNLAQIISLQCLQQN